jgi:membrane protein DedA with SNARE-associated domain
MDLLIQDYGYWAVLLGTFFEGETVLILAGFASYQGYLNLTYVIIMALIGSFAGDQFFFRLGRLQKKIWFIKGAVWETRSRKAKRLLENHQILIILSSRFLYGMRMLLPYMIGMSRVKTSRFVLLDFIGALVWATLIGSLGYLFGNVMVLIMGNIKKYELMIMAIVIGLGLLIWFIGRIRRISKTTK